MLRIGPVSVNPHAWLRTRPGREYVDAWLALFIGVAGGQHHALTQAKLHLARRQVGHHHGELAH